MRKTLAWGVALATASGCFVASAAPSWQAVNGVLDGSLADPAHWSNGTDWTDGLPPYLSSAEWYQLGTEGFTLTVPEDGVTWTRMLRFGMGAGKTITFDTRGSWFYMGPTKEGEVYPSHVPFYVHNGSGGMLQVVGDYGGTEKRAMVLVSNAVMRVSHGTTVGQGFFVDLDSGLFNCMDPFGNVVNRQISLFSASKPDQWFRVHAGSELRAGSVSMTAGAANQGMVVDGGSAHVIAGTVTLGAPSDSGSDVHFKVVGEGTSVSVGSVLPSAQADRSKESFREVLVADGAELKVTGQLNNQAVADWHIAVTNGGTFALTGSTQAYFQNVNAPSTNWMTVADANLFFDWTAEFGYASAAQAGHFVLTATNATIDAAKHVDGNNHDVALLFHHADLDLVDSDVKIHKLVLGASDNANDENVLTVSGANSVLSNHTLTVRGNGERNRMTVRDGALLAVGNTFMVGEGGQKGRLEIADARLQSTGNALVQAGSLVLNRATARFDSANASQEANASIALSAFAGGAGEGLYVSNSTVTTSGRLVVGDATPGFAEIYRTSWTNDLAKGAYGHMRVANGTLRIIDSQIGAPDDCADFYLGFSGTAARPTDVLIGGEANDSRFMRLQMYEGDNTLTVDGGYTQFGYKDKYIGGKDFFRIGEGTGNVDTFNLKSGTVKVYGDRTYTNLHDDPTAYVNVSGGTLDLTESGVFTFNFVSRDNDSQKGTSYLNVSGGKVLFPGSLSINRNIGRGSRTFFALTGGSISVPHLRGAASKTTISNFFGITADGGTVVPQSSASNTGFITADKVELGANGLTFDSKYNLTLDNDFADLTGAEGEGKLSWKGSAADKVLTLASSVPPSVVEILGGSVNFTGTLPAKLAVGPDVSYTAAAGKLPAGVIAEGGSTVAFNGQATALTSLVLGDANGPATLVLAKGETIAVNGPVSINALRLSMDGETQTGDVFTFLTSSQPLSDASLAQLRQAVAVVSMPFGDIAAFDQVYNETSGRYELKMSVVKPAPIVISLGANATSNATEDIAFTAHEQLTAQVGANARLGLDGRYGIGGFSKEGPGRATLTDANNRFTLPFYVVEGTLGATSLAALGGADVILGKATLSLDVEPGDAGANVIRHQTPEGTDAAVVDARTDVTIGGVAVQQGAFIKRGPGRLTVASSGDNQFSTANGLLGNVRYPSAGAGPFAFPADGSSPAGGYGALTVAEGELVLKGTGPNAYFRAGGSFSNDSGSVIPCVMIGMQTLDGAAQPGLVVDGATLDLWYQRSATMPGGSQICSLTLGAYGSAANSFVKEPYLVVTNGGVLRADNLVLNAGRGSDAAFTSRVDIVGSELLVGFIQDEQSVSSHEFVRFRDAYCHCGFGSSSWRQVKFNGNLEIDLDNSVLCNDGTAAAYNPGMGGIMKNSTYSRGVLRVRNGSKMCLAYIGNDDSLAKLSAEYGYLRTVWNNGEWKPTLGDFNFVFNTDNDFTTFEMEGAGMVLDVQPNKTWRMCQRLTGTGGLVKRGAGTLRFETAKKHALADMAWTIGAAYFSDLAKTDRDIPQNQPLTLDFEGPLDVQAGTVEIRSETFGGTLTSPVRAGAAFTTTTGEGTVSGGALVSPRIVLSAADKLLKFDGTTFSGRVKVDLSPLDLAEPPKAPVTVATYTGAAPFAGRADARVLGFEGSNFGTLTCSGGNIVLSDVGTRGVLLIVR